MRTADFLEIIKKNLPKLKEMLNEKLADPEVRRNFNYKSFGVDIEPLAVKSIIDLCEIRSGEYRLASSKNAFPDFKFLPSEDPTKIAIDFKAYRSTTCKGSKANPENDLGTLYSMVQHIEDYGVENMYLFFMEYSAVNGEVEQIYFDNLYKFCKLKEDGTLKYRLKDGNLRPRKIRTEEVTVPAGDMFIEGIANTLPTWSERRKQSIDEQTCDALLVIERKRRII